MNKIEKLEYAHDKLDSICYGIEPALTGKELTEYSKSLRFVQETIDEIKQETLRYGSHEGN